MRIEGVYEHAGVNGVPGRCRRFLARWLPRRLSSGSHLSARCRELPYAAHTRMESALQAAPGAQEGVPGGDPLVFRALRNVRTLEWKDHAYGAAPVRQNVRGTRFSHTTQNPRGVRFQFPNAHSCRCPALRGRRSGVVPHVTTLPSAGAAVNAARSCAPPARGSGPDPRTSSAFQVQDLGCFPTQDLKCSSGPGLQALFRPGLRDPVISSTRNRGRWTCRPRSG
jgi:hypothetical protein